jgi:UDP-N-acetyl-D-mannosaminuronate dehydrogenase
MEENRTVAIVGENPEALFLSVLCAEAGLSNYLVGPFGEDGRTHSNRPGIEEVLWLLGILTRSGRISIRPDLRQLPLTKVRTIFLTTHASSPAQTNSLETTLRNLAPGLSAGTTVAYVGLCRPHYTFTTVRLTVEKQSGLKSGTHLSFYYLPLFWSGERIQEFKEKPKVLASLQESRSSTFQEDLLRVFPALSLAPSVELAEASGLFTAIGRDVSRALGLELAKISETHGIHYDDVLDLCRDTDLGPLGRCRSALGRESVGTEIALSYSPRRVGPKLVRAAHSINEAYQSQVVDLIRRALNHCGHPFRRSRVAILGTDGLLNKPWAKAESLPLVDSLRRKGVQVSLYPGETGSQPWSQLVGDNARVENSLLRAVARASCAVVALPNSFTSEFDVDRVATEMNRPGAICDLTGVLEASNVERAGLFYTTIGRGTLDS